MKYYCKECKKYHNTNTDRPEDYTCDAKYDEWD